MLRPCPIFSFIIGQPISTGCYSRPSLNFQTISLPGFTSNCSPPLFIIGRFSMFTIHRSTPQVQQEHYCCSVLKFGEVIYLVSQVQTSLPFGPSPCQPTVPSFPTWQRFCIMVREGCYLCQRSLHRWCLLSNTFRLGILCVSDILASLLVLSFSCPFLVISVCDTLYCGFIQCPPTRHSTACALGDL